MVSIRGQHPLCKRDARAAPAQQHSAHPYSERRFTLALQLSSFPEMIIYSSPSSTSTGNRKKRSTAHAKGGAGAVFIRKPTLSPDVAKPPRGRLGRSRPTCPARRPRAERSGPRSPPASLPSFPPFLPFLGSPAPSRALRDSGNPPVRLTWSTGRANLFISSAGSLPVESLTIEGGKVIPATTALWFSFPLRAPHPQIKDLSR